MFWARAPDLHFDHAIEIACHLSCQFGRLPRLGWRGGICLANISGIIFRARLCRWGPTGRGQSACRVPPCLRPDDVIAVAVQRRDPTRTDASSVETAVSLRLTDLLVEDALRLTGREQTAEQFLASSPRGVARRSVNVSHKTVVNVCSRLKQKLEVRCLAELIRSAVRILSVAF
jgi:hypothetical protein